MTRIWLAAIASVLLATGVYTGEGACYAGSLFFSLYCLDIIINDD